MTGTTWRGRILGRATMVAAALAFGGSCAQAQLAPQNSPLNAPLFYHLLIGELELNSGMAGNAYGRYLEAAKQTSDASLFQRAVDIALQARAGDLALAAAQAWQHALPGSIPALRYQTQILLAQNRFDDLETPLRGWLAGAPPAELPGLIEDLPRVLQRLPDHDKALAITERLIAPYKDAPDTRMATQVALGRAQLIAGHADLALGHAQQAVALNARAASPVLLAIDMLPGLATAETLVKTHLASPGTEPKVRLAYVRSLAQSQRYADAIQQLEQLTHEQPSLSAPWLTLGALQLELKHPKEAETALLRHVQLVQQVQQTQPTPPAAADNDDDDDETPPAVAAAPANDLTQAWLMLSQTAELRGDIKAAEAYLAKADNPARALEIQSRRASLLAGQGQMAKARALIRATPERSEEDAKSKVLAEAQLLRDFKRWKEAAEVLSQGAERLSDDVDLLYEQAMVEEKLERFTEMERLLRRVIALKPEHPHAHNALGYSLADRNVRLPEARELIDKALSLAPGDPFITDSLAWVEFRLGRRDEAIRLLRQAYQARPDTEIAAHLGEVLWTAGQRDEARRVWAEGRRRDANNAVLQETLTRLKAGL